MSEWDDVRASFNRAIAFYAKGTPADLRDATKLLDEVLFTVFEHTLSHKGVELGPLKPKELGYYSRLAGKFFEVVEPHRLTATEIFRIRYLYRSLRNAVAHVRDAPPPVELVAEFIELAARCLALINIQFPEHQTVLGQLRDAQHRRELGPYLYLALGLDLDLGEEFWLHSRVALVMAEVIRGVCELADLDSAILLDSAVRAYQAGRRELEFLPEEREYITLVRRAVQALLRMFDAPSSREKQLLEDFLASVE